MVPGHIANLVQDRDKDGIGDYLNARIVVADDPSPAELAAAANVAARLAFEVLSVDLPLACSMSAYDPRDSRIPIFIGRAAATAGRVTGLLLASTEDADRFAREYGRSRYRKASREEITVAGRTQMSIESLWEDQPTLVFGSELKCIGVIDLAARIALESTCLKLPIAITHCDGLPAAAILVGRFERLSPDSDSLQRRRGRIQLMDEPGGRTVIAIMGADEEGEAEAVRYAAQRLPYTGDYRSSLSLETVAVDVRRRLSRPSVPSDILIFEKSAHLSWEVDSALAKIEERLLPRIHQGSRVEVELRVSEPPAVRRALQDKILGRLLQSGASPALAEVSVLSAYKQGYSWISETLLPRLKDAHKICIRFRALLPDAKSLDSPIRWLQELYPIDEVLSRELAIPADRIRFERLPYDSTHIYEVILEDPAGRRNIAGTFDPRYITRLLFDRFPDYGHALVSTGSIRALVDGIEVIDERMETDPEQFWNWYQKEVLSAVADHLIGLYGGRIDRKCIPHFGSLEVDVALSEPDYRIGIDEERISTLEALHEDIYFETLLFLDVLGQNKRDRRLAYPGRVIPRVRTSGGGPGFVHVRYTGKPAAGEPWREIATPEIKAIEVEAGRQGLASVEFQVAADCGAADSASLSYPDITAITLVFNDRTIHIDGGVVAKGEPGTPSSRPPSRVATPVQWDTPIGPDECEEIISRLASFPEIYPYCVGESYLGRRIWALDVKTPVGGQYFSQPRASLEKPVLLVTGRQHANEVSSTSHILRLAELLATDNECRKLLERVIFVLLPMTNPDGAQLVEELRCVTPGLMLHACYLGALGVDVTDRHPAASPIYPESEVRPWLIRKWKPSLVLNPHGYPSHEWVQLFAGYTAWVRSRRKTARDWWIPRGWFIPRLAYTREQKQWVWGLLDALSEALEPTTGALNERMRRRYRKYGAFDPATYRMSFRGNLLVRARQSKRTDTGVPLEIVTEVPDEVAEGSWLQAMAHAGLECSLATAKFLSRQWVPGERLVAETPHELLLRVRRFEGPGSES